MRDGWKFTSLGDVLDIQNGYAFDSKKFSEKGDMPLIRIRDLKTGTTTETRYSGDYDSKYVVHDGDLLIGMDGDFACYEWNGGPALLNQRVCRLQDFSSNLMPRFLFYGINKFLKNIEDVTTFTTVKHLSARQIKSIEFPLPPLPEQKRIVAILDEAFSGVETTSANTEKNLANARELFSSFLATLLAHTGKDWRFLTLKEICSDYGRGKSKHRPRNDPMLYGGAYPFIQTGDVRRSDHKIRSYTATYNEKGLEQSKLWPKGTICITIAANIAETGILDFDACFPDSIIGLVVDESNVSREYVEFLLQSLKAVLKAKGKGSAQDNINLGTFESETFPFPPLEIQNDIVQRVDELRKSVRQLECVCIRKLEAFEELKQSLLQKAFSGELTADRDQEELESATA